MAVGKRARPGGLAGAVFCSTLVHQWYISEGDTRCGWEVLLSAPRLRPQTRMYGQMAKRFALRGSVSTTCGALDAELKRGAGCLPHIVAHHERGT